MASRNNPTTHNDTPNTPGVNESDVARLKAADLRERLKRRGVKGTADLKKPELVKKLVKALVAEDTTASKRAGASKASKASKNPTSGNDTPDTPAVNESEIARMKASELRRRLAERGVQGTDELKKPDLVKKMIKVMKTETGKPRSTVRTGKQSPSSLKYSQVITSTDDRPERPGRSLVTTDHEVIRKWAKARKGVPATVVGTEHGGHLGVLRFDFPGYSGDRLTEVSWEDWLATFDKRRLNFIYQEKLSSGKRSNFFQLQSPDGEDD